MRVHFHLLGFPNFYSSVVVSVMMVVVNEIRVLWRSTIWKMRLSDRTPSSLIPWPIMALPCSRCVLGLIFFFFDASLSSFYPTVGFPMPQDRAFQGMLGHWTKSLLKRAFSSLVLFILIHRRNELGKSFFIPAHYQLRYYQDLFFL